MNLRDMVIYQLHEVVPVRRVRNEIFRMQDRPWHGFVAVSSGSYVYTQGGRRIPSDVTHFIYLPKGATYELKCIEDDLSYVVNFECNVCEPALQSFPVDSGSEVSRRVREMAAQADPLRRMAMLYEVMSMAAASHGGAPSYRMIQPGVAFLDARFGDPELNIDAAAQCAGLSTVYFRKLFAENYGVSPFRYVQQLRMAQARRLLCERELTVEQVALACGYRSVYSFSNAFHRITGVSPTGYIRENSRI